MSMAFDVLQVGNGRAPIATEVYRLVIDVDIANRLCQRDRYGREAVERQPCPDVVKVAFLRASTGMDDQLMALVDQVVHRCERTVYWWSHPSIWDWVSSIVDHIVKVDTYSHPYTPR
jgi:hypothetical protein